jgi:hypothetical protein
VVHAVAASTAEKLPLGHVAHDVDPTEELNDPLEHVDTADIPDKLTNEPLGAN